MNILTFDTETTTHNNGNWADKRNKLVMSGFKWLDDANVNIVNHLIGNPEISKKYIQDLITSADIVIGFHIKFDLHWLCNIGVNIHTIKRVWDCQIAEFLLSAQRNPYNSLNDACEKYGIPLKLDVVKTEYWDKGIDTDAIPIPILTEYLEGDVIRTECVFKFQYEQFTGNKI